MTTRAPSPGKPAGGRGPGRPAGGRGPGTPGRPRGRAGLLAAVAVLLAATGLPLPAAAQEESLRQRIRESQERLTEIRSEREQLREELESLTSQVHTVNEEIRNLERQIGTSSSVIAELGVQINALMEQLTLTTADALHTRDRLTARRVVLRQRLREIYKRGPLGAFQVLLAANSFSDLINRYKYLHQVALFDRLLVQEVERLERQLDEQRSRLQQEVDLVSDLSDEKQRELEDLRRLERQRERRLQTYAQRSTQARSRLAQLAEEEQNLRDLVAELERARRETEARTGTATTSTLRTSDLGQLAWPVEGEIAYGFGASREAGATTRRDGIGIRAPASTPVRAVEAGQVVFAGPRNLYGQSVIIDHGGGFYSVYLYMQSLAVRAGQRVAAGQVVGGVGGSGTPEGPHVEFQIWEPSGGGNPRPVDPVRWLRNRG